MGEGVVADQKERGGHLGSAGQGKGGDGNHQEVLDGNHLIEWTAKGYRCKDKSFG